MVHNNPVMHGRRRRCTTPCIKHTHTHTHTHTQTHTRKLSDVGGSEESQLWVVVGGSAKEPVAMCGNWNVGQAMSQQVFRVTMRSALVMVPVFFQH